MFGSDPSGTRVASIDAFFPRDDFAAFAAFAAFDIFLFWHFLRTPMYWKKCFLIAPRLHRYGGHLRCT